MAKQIVEMTKEQAQEMYYNINSYYLFLQSAENVDKTMFGRLRFWNPIMNNHLRKARQSIGVLMSEFNKHFRAKDVDLIHYDAPSELYEAMEFLSRQHPDKIREIINNLKGQ